MSTDFALCKKDPVSCIRSQGAVHALLITASLQKILSDREHIVVLNHPPLSKQPLIKLGGSYTAALAISRHSCQYPWLQLRAVLSTTASSHKGWHNPGQARAPETSFPCCCSLDRCSRLQDEAGAGLLCLGTLWLTHLEGMTRCSSFR